MKLTKILDGRLNRIRFLAYSNLAFFAMLLFGVLVIKFFPELLVYELNFYVMLVISGIAYLPPIVFAVKRYHDVGASGWWVLWYLTPAQPIIFLLLGLTPGMSDKNKFGEPNQETSALLKIVAIVPVLIVVSLLIWRYFIV